MRELFSRANGRISNQSKIDDLGWVRFACENESPFRILSDLARARGTMLATNGWGALELTKVKSTVLNSKQVFKLSNIIGMEYYHDISQCYHKYRGDIAQ